MALKKERSFMWFALPVFLGIIGGLIAYAILRNDNRQMANAALMGGIMITAISIGLILWARSL